MLTCRSRDSSLSMPAGAMMLTPMTKFPSSNAVGTKRMFTKQSFWSLISRTSARHRSCKPQWVGTLRVTESGVEPISGLARPESPAIQRFRLPASVRRSECKESRYGRAPFRIRIRLQHYQSQAGRERAGSPSPSPTAPSANSRRAPPASTSPRASRPRWRNEPLRWRWTACLPTSPTRSSTTRRSSSSAATTRARSN